MSVLITRTPDWCVSYFHKLKLNYEVANRLLLRITQFFINQEWILRPFGDLAMSLEIPVEIINYFLVLKKKKIRNYLLITQNSTIQEGVPEFSHIQKPHRKIAIANCDAIMAFPVNMFYCQRCAYLGDQVQS